VSGQDAGLLRVAQRDPELGFVGDVVSVDPSVVQSALDDGLVPVVATIGDDGSGQAFNVNADTAASAIAVALRAKKLVYLTDIDGIRVDKEDPNSLVQRVDIAGIDALLERGVIEGGMIPKVQSCTDALRGGVGDVHILDGRIPHVLLVELFTDAGIGTMITGANT